jgi:hypothetical protein
VAAGWIALGTYFVAAFAVAIVCAALFAPGTLLLVVFGPLLAAAIFVRTRRRWLKVVLASAILALSLSIAFETSGQFPVPIPISQAARIVLAEWLSGRPACEPCSQGCCPTDRADVDLDALLVVQLLLWFGWTAGLASLWQRALGFSPGSASR